MATGTAQVGTLRVRSTAGDTPAVRLAASAWLGGAELHPSELPPAAVLIVRRMADPLPGKLPSRGPEPPDPAWERAARSSLGGFCRRAARPARGPVPDDAEAVLFVDEAEMLACLALDLARGNAFGRWWWTLVLRRLGARDLPRLLASEPARVPAILHHLEQEHRAAEVCESLSENEAAAILKIVAEAYGTPGSAGVPPAGGREGKAPDPIEACAKPQTHPIRAPQPQWQQRLRAVHDVTRLAPANRVLLAVSLSLFEEPARARSPIFAAELREWWEAGAPLEPRAPYINKDAEPSPAVPRSIGLPDRDAAPAPDRPGLTPGATQFRPPGSENPGSPEPGGRHSVAQGVNPGRGRRAAPAAMATAMPPIPEDRCEVRAGVGARTDTDGDTDTARTEGVSAEGPFAEARPAAEQAQAKADEAAAEDEVQALEEASALLFEDGVATEIAGLFYLINLMTSLDLPDCFEEDWRLASEVGAWGVLDAIARALLADAPHLAADPVWCLLAVLAGREPDEPPGRRYARTGFFRVPEAWPVLHGAWRGPHEGAQQRQGVQRGRLDGQQQRQGVQHGRLDGQRQRQGVQHGRLDGQRQRLEVQRQRLEVERGRRDGEQQRQEVERLVYGIEHGRQDGEQQPLGVVGIRPVFVPRDGGQGEKPQRGAGIKPGVSTPGQRPNFIPSPEGATAGQRGENPAGAEESPASLRDLENQMAPSPGVETPGFMPTPPAGALRPHTPKAARSAPLGLERGALTRWLDLVLPYLRLRLAQGLGLDPARPEDLPPLLLLRPGRVHVTTTHVDIVMDLASISMPVRISGLDRDPGWLPAFGRVVQFHFR